MVLKIYFKNQYIKTSNTDNTFRKIFSINQDSGNIEFE
jgi:hypothetical protein